MVYTLNGRLMTTTLYDNTAEILLENILLAMEDEYFSKDLSAKIVGGEGRLRRLIEQNRIRSEKRSRGQNGKWFCRAGDVLRNCSARKAKKKGKKRKA